jgi:hypothetical protein
MGSIRLSFFLVIFTCFFELSTCRSLASRSVAENSPLWRRQHGGVFSVLGIVAFGDGTPHPRLEIRELEKDKDQWNVFLLGLHRFQNVDQDDELSYYKIAGESLITYLSFKKAASVIQLNIVTSHGETCTATMYTEMYHDFDRGLTCCCRYTWHAL